MTARYEYLKKKIIRVSHSVLFKIEFFSNNNSISSLIEIAVTFFKYIFTCRISTVASGIFFLKTNHRVIDCRCRWSGIINFINTTVGVKRRRRCLHNAYKVAFAQRSWNVRRRFAEVQSYTTMNSKKERTVTRNANYCDDNRRRSL